MMQPLPAIESISASFMPSPKCDTVFQFKAHAFGHRFQSVPLWKRYPPSLPAGRVEATLTRRLQRALDRLPSALVLVTFAGKEDFADPSGLEQTSLIQE